MCVMYGERDRHYLRGLGVRSASKIDRDRACESCGYNLRGLDRKGQCPECGRPIKGVSAGPKTLDGYDTSYLNSQQRALYLLLMAWIVAVPLPLFGPLLGIPSRALSVVALIALVVFGWSQWVLTEPPPKQPHWSVEGRWLRRAIRPATVGLVGFALAVAVLGTTNLASAAWWGWLTLLAWTGMLAAQAGSCLVLEAHALRAPDDALASRLWNLSWTLALFGPIAVLVSWMIMAINLLACIFALIVPFALFVTQIYYGLSVYSLVRSYTWAKKYQASTAARDARLRERLKSSRSAGPGPQAAGLDPEAFPTTRR